MAGSALSGRWKRKQSIVETVFRRSLAVYMLNSATWAVGALVDGIVIGRYLGVDAMAAYGLAAPVILICGLIGAVFSGGSRNVYTRLAGHGKAEEANGVFTLACVSAVVLSLLAIGMAFSRIDSLAQLLGAGGLNAQLRPLVVQFLHGYMLGLPFDSVARILAAYLPMDSDHRRTFVAAVAMTVVDIAGDLIAVLCFEGNLFLIGLMTAIGQVVYFSVLSSHFFLKNRMLHFRFRRIISSVKWFGSILANGAAAGLTRIAGSVSGILVNSIVSQAAPSAYIAAFSICKTLSSLVGVLYLGVADTVWMLSSIYYGEEDRKALDDLQIIAYRIGGILSFLNVLVLFTFSRFFASFFISHVNPGELEITSQAIRWLAVSIPLYVATYLFDDYLMGTGKLISANIYSYLLEFGVIVPVVWLMVRRFGGSGAWLSLPVSLLIMLLIALCYILLWKYGKTFRVKRLLLKKNFGTESGKELNISADSLIEVCGMSRIVKLFCEENQVDPKRAYKLALCVEELGSNIIEHGFHDGKPHSIDIRILVKEDDLILRIRDDCIPFNLPERYALLERQEDTDPTRNMGIRMVMKMSSDVQYLSTMNTNNLIIRF